MAKNKNRSYNQPGNNANPSNSGKNVQLEKMLPTWNASFESASQVLGSCKDSLEIKIDPDYLKALLNSVPDDKANQFKIWLQRFAETCKALSKYQSNLENEYSTRWNDCNGKGLELENKEIKLQDLEAQLNNKQSSLIDEEFELERLQNKLAEMDADLANRERKIIERERNASAGFAKQSRASLEQLKSEQTETISAYNTEISTLSQQKSRLERDIETTKILLTEAEKQRLDELDKKEQVLQKQVFEHQANIDTFKKTQASFELTQQALEEDKQAYKTELDLKHQFNIERLEKSRQEIKATLSLEREQLDSDWQDLQEAKDNLSGLVDEKIAQERMSHKSEISRLKEKLNTVWDKVDELKAGMESYQELESALGDQSAQEVLQQLDDLKQENRSLRREHSESESKELTTQNEALRSRVDELEKELTELRPELDRVRIEAAQKRIAATEMHAVAQEKRVLEQHKNTLSVHIDDLESRIEKLTDAHKTQTPFPAMSEMDSSPNFQASIEPETIPSLDNFAQELQHRIAQIEQVNLYYPLEDIQSLIAGLAMSQLHVFQGISGTGKTSLAKAFAKAMGGFCTDIAVQAGWRDRDDLLGHYNAFERRFYEKDCLQALYQAQTPRWKDTCNVILLDEMNLSHPEQYFSEFLSALEKNDYNDRLISLSETPLPNAPKGLKYGRQILVPRNIWFIGTANHDETTMGLADKTYDRAHVMTLPKQDTRFDILPFEPINYSYRSLQKAFEQACSQYAPQIQQRLDQLTGHGITNLLSDSFELGWGNRFEQQAKRFIPVMIACGATEGQALDHLLSTRVMRSGKVTDRYTITAEEIGRLTDALQDFWSSGDLEGDPTKSLQLLNADRQRKERGL